jgi:CheY-like chemotaxis protein/two-component sensor histidine kinase
LDVVARNTRVLAQLISDLLDMSRIVAGKLRLDLQRVNLESVIADALETVRQDAELKGIDIELEVDTAVGSVAGDPTRLQQVVWNLLSNAVKFSRAAGRIRVTLRRAGLNAEIAVADDGAGIRPELLPQVFDRFQQADRSITRRFGGLGLGLSIVKSLVELHGGSVRAESAGEGRGSRFTIALPAGDPSRLHDGSAAIPPGEMCDAISLAAARVLVVEDEPDTREFVKRLLETNGAVVVAAGTASEALSLFQSARPDILISDIGLPEVDGYDLMRQIRRHDVTDGGGIPAIALTAYARSEDRTRALRAGYQAHVAKPVEANELLATVASFAGIIDPRRKR